MSKKGPSAGCNVAERRTQVDQAHLRRMLERGDHAAFIAALEPLCQREVGRTAPNGLEHEDLMQEARFAVLKVARTWDPARKANPLTLAVTFVRNQLWKVANEQRVEKRRGNHEALRLDGPASARVDDGGTLGALTPATGATVEEIVEHRDELEVIARRLSVLPPRLLEDLDDTATPERRKAARVCAFVARGGSCDERTVYVRWRAGSDADTVLRRIERLNPGCIAVSATKRRLLDGRELAPQGRPTGDGRRGERVWRVDLICLPSHDHQEVEAA